jgi:hypothetical protein
MPDEKWGVGPICPVHIEFRRAALSLYRWGSPKAQKELSMMKSLVTAAVLSCGLTGYALAQATVTGAPEGTAPVTAEPVHHHHWHWHHHWHHHHHHMHEMAPPPAAPAPAPPPQ